MSKRKKVQVGDRVLVSMFEGDYECIVYRIRKPKVNGATFDVTFIDKSKELP